MGVLDFWIFCVLHFCCQSVETAPKLDPEKTASVSVFTVLVKGCACRRGVTRRVYIHIYVHVHVYPYLSSETVVHLSNMKKDHEGPKREPKRLRECDSLLEILLRRTPQGLPKPP